MSQRVLGTWLVLGAVLLCGTLVLVVLGEGDRDHNLPLADTEIIRAQAAEKKLDPALIAAVIYCESKFEPRPSSAGAEGLMQILPETAYYLAKLSGGRSFTSSDLATPSVNVAYGSYYLRYLLDHYGGNVVLALAAYNGGLANVDRWVAHADADGRRLSIEEIPFPETREYVRRVLDAEHVYRSDYAHELGIA
ncbi:MAG TPA: lytic transglycosylase domain-containing protein [Solirubrobacteraceae bacterium]|nr:lytic transglycosylase domain-containing protein [Solirubrobacteraceae bacterium]